MITQKHDDNKYCNECGVELTYDNWWKSSHKSSHYRCINCNKKISEENRRKKGIQPRKKDIHFCRFCGIIINYKNTTISRIKKKDWICKKCHRSYSKNFKNEHKEYYSEYNEDYYIKNKDKHNENGKLYYQNNKENIKEACKFYESTLKGKEVQRKSQKKSRSKRRKLGYIYLNEEFKHCHGHHVDEQHIINVPKWINRICYHNVHTGKGMDVVNAMAYFFLLQQNIKELSEMFN